MASEKKPVNKLKSDKIIEFAPMNISFSRRLETAAAVYYSITSLIFPFAFIALYFVTPAYIYWPILLANILWVYYDGDTPAKGGRRFDFMRRLAIWRKLRDYFPAKLVKVADFDTKKNYLCGYHPHGIISTGAFLNFGTEATNIGKVFPGIKFHLLTLISNFRFPAFRDYVLSCGACSVSRESMNYILSKPGGGNAAVVVVGGAREAMYSNPHNLMLHLKSRKGFIKVAIQNGADLVPVFTFGETEVILQVDNPEGSLLRKFQKKFLALTGYAPVVITGRGIFQYSYGTVPLRRPLTTIVGAPIPVTKNSNPSQEEIDALHEKYMDDLKILYYTHRDKYGDSEVQLTIV